MRIRTAIHTLHWKKLEKTLKEEGIDYEIFQIGGKPVRDCIGCGQCTEKGCVFDDDACKLNCSQGKNEADGFVFGTPVYYAHPSGRVQSFLDRVFYSSGVTSPVSRVLLWQWQDVADAVLI